MDREKSPSLRGSESSLRDEFPPSSTKEISSDQHASPPASGHDPALPILAPRRPLESYVSEPPSTMQALAKLAEDGRPPLHRPTPLTSPFSSPHSHQPGSGPPASEQHPGQRDDLFWFRHRGGASLRTVPVSGRSMAGDLAAPSRGRGGARLGGWVAPAAGTAGTRTRSPSPAEAPLPKKAQLRRRPSQKAQQGQRASLDTAGSGDHARSPGGGKVGGCAE